MRHASPRMDAKGAFQTFMNEPAVKIQSWLSFTIDDRYMRPICQPGREGEGGGKVAFRMLEHTDAVATD